jgi:hypothetical protein
MGGRYFPVRRGEGQAFARAQQRWATWRRAVANMLKSIGQPVPPGRLLPLTVRAGQDRLDRLHAAQRTLCRRHQPDRVGLDEALAALLTVFDEYIRKTGIEAPEEPPRDPGLPPPIPSGRIRELDLRGAGIGAVVWATGFRYDFRWIDLPIFTNEASPRTAGVSPRSPACPSLASSGSTSGSRPSSTASRRTPPTWLSTSPRERERRWERPRVMYLGTAYPVDSEPYNRS